MKIGNINSIHTSTLSTSNLVQFRKCVPNYCTPPHKEGALDNRVLIVFVYQIMGISDPWSSSSLSLDSPLRH